MLRRTMTALAAAMAMLLSVVAVPSAGADPAFDRNVSFEQFMNTDILMGSFFATDADHSDTVYISTDGVNFEEVATAYQDAFPGDPGNNVSTLGPIHYTLGDPSIMYHNGAFWMLSGWNRGDGKFWPMIGVSYDARHWSFPEGLRFGPDYDGIPMFPGPRFGVDTVAPEWVRDNAGNVYIMFSAGDFGQFHGRPMQDRMEPYLVKIDELTLHGMDDRLPHITMRAQPAHRINLPNPDADRIDGSAF